MGREVRMVRSGWQHPKDVNGGYIPLHDGYKAAADEFIELANDKGLQEAVDCMRCPDKDEYMPDWEDKEKTHLMMYEDTTEGTPISPAFKTPDELAKWLADNGASSFGASTATYEQWLGMINVGWAPSAVLDNDGIKSGVEAISALQTSAS